MSQQPPEEPGPVPPGPIQPAPPTVNPYVPYVGNLNFGAPDHPQATAVLILGIISLSACQLVGPVAWVMGSRAKKEIDAAPGRYGGRQQVVIGMVLGIVGTGILALYLLGFLVYLVFAVIFVASSS